MKARVLVPGTVIGYVNGKPVRAVRGGSEAPPEPPAPPSPPAPAPAGDEGKDKDKHDRTFDQAAVTRIAHNERTAGERAGRAALLKELGLGEDAKAEYVKAKLTALDAAEEAKLSEADKARRDAEADRQVAATERAQAAADRLAARKERTLLAAGVAPDGVGDVAKLLELPPEADEAAEKAAVEALKTRHPGLFGTGTPPLPSGGGAGGTPPRPTPNGDAYQRGIERAKALAAGGSS